MFVEMNTQIEVGFKGWIWWHCLHALQTYGAPPWPQLEISLSCKLPGEYFIRVAFTAHLFTLDPLQMVHSMWGAPGTIPIPSAENSTSYAQGTLGRALSLPVSGLLESSLTLNSLPWGSQPCLQRVCQGTSLRYVQQVISRCTQMIWGEPAKVLRSFLCPWSRSSSGAVAFHLPSRCVSSKKYHKTFSGQEQISGRERKHTGSLMTGLEGEQEAFFS